MQSGDQQEDLMGSPEKHALARYREAEKVVNRVLKICRNELWNPFDVFFSAKERKQIISKNSQLCEQDQQRAQHALLQEVKKRSKALLLLVHPDKTFNEPRFEKAVQVVAQAKRSLTRSVAQLDDWLTAWALRIPRQFPEDSSSSSSSSKSTTTPVSVRTARVSVPAGDSATQLDLYRGKRQLKVLVGELSQLHQDGDISTLEEHRFDVTSHVALDGAEHTKNKNARDERGSISSNNRTRVEKHQKGLRQRAVAKRAAERRLRRQQFSFTQNYEIKKKENN